MKYFDKDFLQFFKDLATNNHRDWFQENKKRYESSVKDPFEIFVSDLITYVRKHDKQVNIKPSEAIFRINKDIRFSKDKTPYKLNTSAVVAEGGRKSTGASGIYIELGPEKVGLAGGIYMPDKELLQSIREMIAKNPKALMKALEDKKFKSVWGDLQGERNKVIPAEFRETAITCPYILNKQFYYWVELDPKLIISDKLMPTMHEHYEASKVMSHYLNGVFSNKKK